MYITVSNHPSMRASVDRIAYVGWFAFLALPEPLALLAIEHLADLNKYRTLLCIKSP